LKLATIKNADVHLGCSGQFATFSDAFKFLPEISAVFKRPKTPNYCPAPVKL